MTRPISSSLAPDKAQRTGQLLQETLTELIDLSLLGKQAHWNVVGSHFRSVHLQLDDLVAATRQHSDTVAERAAAVGHSPNGQARDLASSSTLAPLAQGWLEDDKVVAAIVDRLGEAISRIRARMEELDELGPTSQDLLNDVLHDLEEQHWMFQASRA